MSSVWTRLRVKFNSLLGVPAMSTKILRLKDVISCIGLSRSSIYSKVQDGSFPPPIKLGARAIGWPEDVITDWINQRIADASGGDHE